MPRRRRIPRATIVALSVTVGLASFGIGFLVSYDPGGGPEVADATAQTTSSDPEPPLTSSSTTTAPPTTTAAPTTTTTATEPPTTPVPTPAPTSSTSLVVPTLAPPTVPPTTAGTPAFIDVIYPRNGFGQMVLRAGGVAAITLHNIGGSTGTFQVIGVGPVTVGATGSASGSLQPGEIRSIPVVAGTGVVGPGPHATITVFDANGQVLTIQLVISSL